MQGGGKDEDSVNRSEERDSYSCLVPGTGVNYNDVYAVRTLRNIYLVVADGIISRLQAILPEL